MSTQKHTPGPWIKSELSDTILDSNYQQVITTGKLGYDNTPGGEAEANANLIAAAPTMLETLKSTAARLEEYRKKHGDPGDRIMDAIIEITVTIQKAEHDEELNDEINQLMGGRK